MKPMKLLLITMLALSVQLVSAQSKYEWKQATSGGYTYKYVTNDPMKARFYTLKNGLTVVLSVNKKEPRVAVRIPVRAGSNTDPKDHTGLAHYLEHLLFKGTDKYGSLDWAKEKPLLDKIDGLYEQYNSTKDEAKRKEIYKEIDRVSGEAAKFAIANEYDKMMAAMGAQGTNAHTWVEETVYEEDVPSNAIDKFLDVQAERFRNPVLRIFHTELEAVYEEKNRSLDEDGWKMQDASHYYLFPTHNYGQQTTIGTIEHLKNPSLNAIRDYYYKYYVPNNMAIVMAGDIDPDKLIKQIDDRFSYMKSKPVQEYNPAPEKPLAGPIIKDIYGPSAESMQLCYRVGASDSKEALMAVLVSSILSNGKAGLFDLNLNKQQKVLRSGAGVRQYKDYGVFSISAAPKQGQTLEEVKDLLMEQISILKKGDFDESLIKAIVANYKLFELQGLENNANRVESITDAFIKNKGTKWINDVEQLDAMGRISKKDVVAFANQFFADNYVVLYKRKGEDKNVVKVEKPTITPVETNATKQSPFVKAINDKPLSAVKPLWLDFDKDIQKGKAGNAEILYVPNKENSLFRMYYYFDMGSWNSKQLSLALQYLQFIGTDKYSAEQISKEFYNLACSFSASAGTETTTLSLSGLNENFEKAVKLFEELVRTCKPDEAALEGLKNRLVRTRANNKLNKNAIMSALRSYGSYGALNPFNYTLTNDEIKNLKAADLVNILHSIFSFEHKVIYYGPKTLPELTASLKTNHQLPATWTAAPAPVKFERTIQKENSVLFADYDMVQSEIYWVRNLEQYDPKKEAVTSVFNNYFGGGMGAIVFQTIRESKALAYSTFAALQTPGKKEDKFAFIAYVGSQADKFHEAINGMNELINDLPEAEQTFENAKKSLLKDYETERITKDAIVFNYLAGKRKGVDHDIRKDIYTQASAITFNDLKKLHDTELSRKPYTYAVVASEKKVTMDDLKKYGAVKKVSLEELFGY
ncbi:M16 family metallopeptidase [Sediminibacterium ginsengisoli]|uniref:Predicted Zn-dependent peptidase n=1 Tax=Sediminibacterium ginsengisoli TaxID=413434 RepID=A0A1T4N8F3_9BACT|nr:insulinase family protein [Sediminibacterium ginsengisoli]SJZ75499.1 Predicted Zn-dependent peptidase [Sediminibacterium ginsengisoli]